MDLGLFWFGTLLGPEATAVPLPVRRGGGCGLQCRIAWPSPYRSLRDWLVAQCAGWCWWVFEI